MTFVFRDLSLRQAEESLVAGCLDHEHALIAACRELGPHPFRSEAMFELDSYYVTLINGYLSGSYNEHGNREGLARRYPQASWRITDELFDGNTAVAAYCEDLVAALRDTYEAQDVALAAARALYDTPVGYLAPLREIARAKAQASEAKGDVPPDWLRIRGRVGA